MDCLLGVAFLLSAPFHLCCLARTHSSNHPEENNPWVVTKQSEAECSPHRSQCSRKSVERNWKAVTNLPVETKSVKSQSTPQLVV